MAKTKNITLEEYDELLVMLRNDMHGNFPAVSFDLSGQSLSITHLAEDFPSTGSVHLRSLGLDAFKRQRFIVKAAFSSTHCPEPQLSQMRLELRRYEELLEALTYADANFCDYVIWQSGECPCDDCQGAGEDIRGKVCKTCGGKGVR